MDRFSKFKIEHNSLSEKAYKTIKYFIIENSLKPGEKIIQEKMAEQLGISKIPLIQALTLLSNEGLLEKLPRKGFYVRKFSKAEINNIFDIRSALEVLSVSIMTENLTPEIKKILKDFLKDFESSYEKKSGKKYYDLDVKFHSFLIKSSNNELLENIFENFNILLICYTRGFVLAIHDSFKQHKNLINAILKQDKITAEAAIREHITKVKEKFNYVNS
jgi:DNA-binding GntR family transcriptional regulator